MWNIKCMYFLSSLFTFVRFRRTAILYGFMRSSFAHSNVNVYDAPGMLLALSTWGSYCWPQINLCFLFILILYHLVIALCKMSHQSFIQHNQIEASTRGMKNKNINQHIITKIFNYQHNNLDAIYFTSILCNTILL